MVQDKVDLLDKMIRVFNESDSNGKVFLSITTDIVNQMNQFKKQDSNLDDGANSNVGSIGLNA